MSLRCSIEKCYHIFFSKPISVFNHLLLVPSVDNLFKQFGPRSGLTKCEVLYEPSLLERKCSVLFSGPIYAHNNMLIAPDKAGYCVFIQFRGPENAIKIISVRTKTQQKSLILNSELFRSL